MTPSLRQGGMKMARKDKINDRRDDLLRSLQTDRRRYARVEAQIDTVYESPYRMLIAGQANLNLRGMRISTPFPDPVGTPVCIRFSLPGDSGPMIMARGVVVWCKGERTSLVKDRGMGIRFTQLSDEARKRIAAFMLRNGGLRTIPKLHKRYPYWIGN